MQFTQLVAASARQASGMAIAGFGWQLGRDVYRNVGNLLALVLASLIGAGGFVLPFLAARRITQWYPVGFFRYFCRIFAPWMVAAAVGLLLLFGLMFLVAGLTLKGQRPDSDYLAAAGTLTLIFGAAALGSGALVGLFSRRKRRQAYQVLLDNQTFLNTHGIRELDGGNITHVDGEGNHLRLEHVGKDLIEFKVIGERRRRSFIVIGLDGRFQKYSSVVEA